MKRNEEAYVQQWTLFGWDDDDDDDDEPDMVCKTINSKQDILVHFYCYVTSLAVIFFSDCLYFIALNCRLVEFINILAFPGFNRSSKSSL